MISLFMVVFYTLLAYNAISYLFFWFDFTNTKKDPNFYDVTDELILLGKSQAYLKSDSHYPRKMIDLTKLEGDVNNERVLYL